MPALTRRDLIRLLGGAALIAKLPACGDNTSGNPIFNVTRLRMLNGLADAVIPPDDEPGGAKLGAAAYITGLIEAYYAVGAPRIYANGPFSDRNPNPDGTYPVNEFDNFVELDRVSDASWRLRLFGSSGVASGGPNDALLGPIIGLQDQLFAGLDAAQALDNGKLTHAEIFDQLDDGFRALLIDLVTEAAFAAPEYGGNPGGAGWAMVHFEGDSQPRGYSQFDGTRYLERPEAPLSTPNPGADPEPLSADIRQLLATVVSVLGGHVNR